MVDVMTVPMIAMFKIPGFDLSRGCDCFFLWNAHIFLWNPVVILVRCYFISLVGWPLDFSCKFDRKLDWWHNCSEVLKWAHRCLSNVGSFSSVLFRTISPEIEHSSQNWLLLRWSAAQNRWEKLEWIDGICLNGPPSNEIHEAHDCFLKFWSVISKKNRFKTEHSNSQLLWSQPSSWTDASLSKKRKTTYPVAAPFTWTWCLQQPSKPEHK